MEVRFYSSRGRFLITELILTDGLFLSQGAYYTASAATHRLITISLSKQLDARVFVPNYRLAPDTLFPGPVHDAAAAYLRLTEDLKIPAANILIAGDSAGAGLTVALMMYLRDEGYPLPGGAILMCPWVGELRKKLSLSLM